MMQASEICIEHASILGLQHPATRGSMSSPRIPQPVRKSRSGHPGRGYNPMVSMRHLFSLTLALMLAAPGLPARTIINEIMYHPVEKPAFDAAGDPVMDLSDDVHEFIELKNDGPEPVALAGWRLAGGADFVFPTGTTVPAGGYVVVAKHPDRLEAIVPYALPAGTVLGPWDGGLGNRGDTVRLEKPDGSVEDAVSYDTALPWPIGANALGAESDWTGIDESQHQYRGRSLERAAAAWASNDPANWLASPLAAGPSPGRANAITLTAPLPVVTAISAVSATSGSTLIRANEPVRIEARFSSRGAGVQTVQIEYFKDETNATNEVKSTLPMSTVADQPGLWRAQLPAQTNRSITRYRLLADHGAGPAPASPRADDPGSWHAFFVSPVRNSTRAQYDVFVSSASLSTLSSNISRSPRRIVNPDPPGNLRESWNATQPATLVRDGRVYDVRIRYHGSRYSRNPGRNSFKIQFPRYARLDGLEGMFFKDKGDDHRIGSQLHRAAGLPALSSRYVDLFLNTGSVLQRLEVPEMDENHFEKFAAAQAARFPGSAVEPTGEFYKSTGVVPFETAAGIGATSVYVRSGEGPYYIGNCAPIPEKSGWSQRQRYEHTYGGQMHQWIGGRDTQAMITGLWAARGDSPTSPNPNLPALRAWLEENFDVDATLRYIAIRNWCAPFDNATHNHFLWRRANGRWGMLPWDLDGELVNSGQSIYWDEYAVPQPDTLRGPQWIKDSFLKAWREEYKQILWLLNNTILRPANFGATGYNGAQSFATARHASVNAQLGLGTFHRPLTPVASSPEAGASVAAGAMLQATAYAHEAPAPAPTPSHASTTWMIRAAGSTWETPVVRHTSTSALTSFPIPFSSLVFGSTYFWKCLYTDTDGHPSFESPEQSFIFGTPSTITPDVRLNEVFARGTGPDFIEIHNAGTLDAELSGMGLTDDPARPAKYLFPTATVLPPGGFLSVTLDEQSPFRLDGDGQTVVLLHRDGTVADALSFGPQADNRSTSRGPGGWELGIPTPGAGHQPDPTGPPTGLRINEWMASNPDGADWFEIVNTSHQPVSLAGVQLRRSSEVTSLPTHSFIGPGGFQQFVADRSPGPNHTVFKLSSNGETIIVADAEGKTIDTVTFGPQESGVAEGLLPDGVGPVARFPQHATPGEPNAFFLNDIVISRLFPDIEVFNRSSTPVVIDGWGLSDTLDRLNQFMVPAGFGAVPPGGTRVIAAATLPFALNTLGGGKLYLSHDGTHRSRQSYGAWDGHPWGLVERATGAVFVRIEPTPPTPGNVPVVGPVIVSEINYHPPDVPGKKSGNESGYEFVEWLNTSNATVDLTGWRLAGDADFTVPEGTLLAPDERIVIAATSPQDHASRYQSPPNTRILGPWSGRLSKSQGNVQIVRPLPPVATPGPDFGFQPEIVLENINYTDTIPWPEIADGGGPALVRTAPTQDGREASSWSTEAPSPGTSSSPNQSPSVSILSPAQGTVTAAGRPLTLSVNAADPDGTISLVSLEVDGVVVDVDTTAPYAFTWSSVDPGTHALRLMAVDNRLATATAEISLTLTNDPPLAALLSPNPYARFTENDSIILEAVAFDPEGMIERVEFLVDGTVVGTATSPPWRLPWIARPPGHHRVTVRAIDATGLSSVSPPAGIVVVGIAPVGPVIACQVPAGTVGQQNYNGSLGHDFEVLTPIVVTRLGVFDSGSNGLSNTLTAQLWRSLPSPQLLRSMTFTTAAPGTLAAGTSSRFKDLTTPLVLGPGTYTTVAYGYSASEPNGNAGIAAPVWTSDTGGGLIRFIGGGRHGPAAQFPGTVDGGPADRYAAPTFEFINADGDGDGLPLDWEITHAFNPEDPSDGPVDTDGDGHSNQEEYAAGTHPRQATSSLELELVEATATQTTVRLVLPAQRTATLQWSRELVFWINHQTIAATAAQRTIEFKLPAESGRFLRVLVQP